MGFVLSAVFAAITLIAATLPAITIPSPHGDGDEPLFPAPPGYQLPWAGGEIELVTQGEETSFTHNGTAAYAFDFGLNYDTVVAARSGRVSMVFAGSNRSGCDPALNIASNYIVIDHGDDTSAQYLHLAYNSALVKPGDLVEQGQPIAVSGDTGTTCSDDEAGPAPHLHFQVQRTEEHRYMTQSLPVAFDDVDTNEGVPVEGQEYVSGNYGSGKPQKSTLTPYRSQRVFAPKATPADPSLQEIPFAPETPAPVETPPAAETPAVTATTDDTPTAEVTVAGDPSSTAVPSDTPAQSDTPTPAPSDTPLPLATPTSAVTETPLPLTGTPEPAPSDTATPEPDTATPEPTP